MGNFVTFRFDLGFRQQPLIHLMKTTSLLSYITALTFTVVIGQIIAGQEATVSVTAFCTAFFALMMVRDYTPRSVYLVTPAPATSLTLLSR